MESPMPKRDHPVSHIRWVPLEKVVANDYNPNRVAPNEMRLLYTSIKADGYTQPVVTYYDAERDMYIIVDGFHRYLVCKTYPDIRESTGGLLPVVVIDRPLNDRMASTRMAEAQMKVACTMSGAIVLGSTCRNRIRRVE